ncbi:MAG: hypothetical protein LRY63_03080 [Nitrincola sp.]|nr:hypothetical protein [Nitrincola sp.]
MERLEDLTHLLSEHSDIPASQLNVLWELLHPPQDLTRLKLVLLNLQKLLNAKTVDLTVFSKEVDQQFDLNTITELLNRLESLENELPQELLDLNTGTRGFTDEHPEWAMLIMSPHNVYFDDPVFRSHQWVVFQCAIIQRLRLNVGEITSIGTEISTACRNIRFLALGKTKVSDLPEVSSFSSLRSYQRSFVKKDSKPLKMFMGIELLTRKVADHIGKSRERTGNNLSDRVKHVIQRYEDDDPCGPSQQTRYFQSIYRQKDLENARSQGLHPDEFVTESSISIAYDKDKPLAGYEPVDHVRRQSAQIKHIAKANQRLPFRYPQLNAVELSWLGYHLAKLFHTKNDISKHIEYPQHVATLLMLMLWLGRPLDQLLSLRIYKCEADLPSGKEGLVAYLIEEDSYVIPIPTPEWKNRLSDKAQSILYNAFDGEPVMLNDVIIVASPVNIGRFLDYLYCVNHRPKRVNYVPAFPDVSHEFFLTGAKAFSIKAK